VARHLRAPSSGENLEWLECSSLQSLCDLRTFLSTWPPEDFCGDENVVSGEKSGPSGLYSLHIVNLTDSSSLSPTEGRTAGGSCVPKKC
jgi:hypothetical protein